MVALQKDRLEPNSDVRQFNKKDKVLCSQEISLMGQKVPINVGGATEFVFDSYDDRGGCYIAINNFHYYVNESSLTKIFPRGIKL